MGPGQADKNICNAVLEVLEYEDNFRDLGNPDERNVVPRERTPSW